MLSAATITAICSRTLRSWAATSIRARRGSVGILAMSRPVSVSGRAVEVAEVPSLPGAKAPSSWSSWMPSRTDFLSGGWRKGNSEMSPSPRDAMERMTLDRCVRRISGSVNSGRASKFCSEYRRIAIPSEVRPHRPDRWRAEAWLISSTGSRWTLVRWEYREMRA